MSGCSTEDGVILAIYDAVTREDALPRLLRLLAERFGCAASALAYADIARPRADVALGHGALNDAAMDRYRRDFAHLDPAPRLLGDLPLGSVVATGRVFSERDLAENAFFQGFYRPLGLAETMGGPVAKGDGRFGVIGLLRDGRRPPFDERDLSGLTRLMPHLIKALELRRAFFTLENRVGALETAMDPVPVGVMLFSDGALAHANETARAILGQHDGLRLDRSGRLRASHAETDRTLRGWFAGHGLDVSAVASVPRDSAGPAFGLRATRYRKSPSNPQAVELGIVLTDPQYRSPNHSKVISELFRMSAATAQLTAALVDGEDLQAYAKRVGITLHTARYHLKNAFIATGTRRQAELVRQVGIVARDLG